MTRNCLNVMRKVAKDYDKDKYTKPNISDGLFHGLFPIVGGMLAAQGFRQRDPELALIGGSMVGPSIARIAMAIADAKKASKKAQYLTYALTAVPASIGMGALAYNLADRIR